MDSTLILQFAESLSRPRSLVPPEPAAFRRDLCLTGLALAACEKAVQLLYERQLRPAEKQHSPWTERVGWQLAAAYEEIERDLAGAPLVADGPPGGAPITQAGIAVAVAWHFTLQVVADAVRAERFPAIARLSARAEALPAFRAAPHGDGTYRPDGAA